MGDAGARRCREAERGFAPSTSNRVGLDRGGAAVARGVVGRVTRRRSRSASAGCPTAEVRPRRVPVAVTLPSRLLGLALLRPGRAGAGLLIPRCRSVHTFGMRFALRVVFLDGALPRSRFARRSRRGGSSASRGPPRSWRLPRMSAAEPAADRDGGRLRGRRADAGAALREPRGRPVPGPAGAVRRRRAAPLPLQAARPDDPRPHASRTPSGSRSCARSAAPTAPPAATTRSCP